MWALRRASIPLKNRGFRTRVSVALSTNSALPSDYSDGSDGNCESVGGNPATSLYSKRFYPTTKFPSKFSMERRSYSATVGAKSSGEDDDSEELETPTSDDVVVDSNNVNGYGLHSGSSESFESDDDTNVEEYTQNELQLDTKIDISEKNFPKEGVISGLFKAIRDVPGQSVHSAIDKWVDEGNELGRPEYAQAMRDLRKRRLYGRALQLSEWVEKNNKIDLLERDYASRIDLITKVHGLFKAEQFIEKIPASFRGEVVYRTLMVNAVNLNNLSKAEEVFKKMKDLEFPLTIFACNTLLLLYKRFDKQKIADVLLLMKKENLKPDLATYSILVNIKGQTNDITGLDKIVENMKEEGIEPNIPVQASIARYYISAGQKEKAEALVQKIEGSITEDKQKLSGYLLPLYAALGKADEVQKLWKLCKSNCNSYLPLAAIEAWGKLNKVEEAEAVFNETVKAKKVSPKLYLALLKIYANNKMLAKGEELVKQMSDSKCRMGPLTCDTLVKLYIEAGQIKKAGSVLQEGVEKNRIRPMFNSYLRIMEEYAKRGDIHNTENIFYKMKQQGGYPPRGRQFQVLISAYVNAKAPLYGISERMKADKFFPNRSMAEQLQLAQVDAIRKTTLAELID